jgi:hypothetical protein
METPLSIEFSDYLGRVKTLTDAGIAPPKSWLELRDRFDRFRAMPLSAAQRVIDALTRPTRSDDVPMLYAHVLAETALPHFQAIVDNTVAAAIETKLRELYAPAAQGIYAKAAERFNQAAQAFTDAAAATDTATTDAGAVAAMTDEQTQAWADAPTLAVQLGNALPILTTAAELAGKTVNPDDGGTLALCIDTAGADKRRLWAAWETETGRCGRFGALYAAGAKIRACPDLDTFAPYVRPKPLEVRREPEPGAPRGYYRDVVHDPEAPGYRPPAEPEQTMIPGKRLIAK